ncbi:hypothetical protein GIB67_023347 [Kingdonia uniflora]|uniref:Protein kinase domain-containing protein n=1 Tax=Kingdonia uniflora TaxID=39325 RepID=A0A7J7LIC9_9MAGN|nr:hypothetical protein GIB67_023347 [Kingdonia uniflora]
MSSNNDPFTDFQDQADSTFKWFLVAGVVSAIIGTIATILIVYAIIDCLKKTGNLMIPKYTQISDSEKLEIAESERFQSQTIKDTPDFQVIPTSQIKTETMERFISDMAREKPIRFSPQHLESFTHNFSSELGSGGFGKVYKGEFPNGVQVAVKVLNGSLNKRVQQQFMAEVSTIGRTYHINLVRLYGFCFDPTMRALVYECMENGSLDKYLFSENQIIGWEQLNEVAIGTAKGIAYLHEECEQRIIHYDIKPGNILLDMNFSPKVADFGLAKLCNRDSSHMIMTECKGTPGYAAPELWMPYPVTHKCDVYSFGILLFEIIGRRRHHDDSLNQSQEWLPRWVWEKFEKGELDEMMELYGIEEKNKEKAERMSMVALWCVQYLPEARPLMSTVVKMLEGGLEISSPPNPFRYLESSALGVSSGGSSKISLSSSTSNAQDSELSHHSAPLKSIFEIEIVS